MKIFSATIYGTSDKFLDGQRVKVCGIAHDLGDNKICIVELEKPRDGWTHIVLSYSCLSKDE